MRVNLVDHLFDTVAASTADADVVWICGVALAATALRRTDQLNRERLLRGVERELRDDLVGIAKLEDEKKASPVDAGWPQWTPA
jgi:hypothetical protein